MWGIPGAAPALLEGKSQLEEDSTRTGARIWDGDRKGRSGKVRASLFPPRGGQSKGTRDGTGRSRQPRAQPGIAAFPGGSEGLGCPGIQGKPGPEPPDPPA